MSKEQRRIARRLNYGTIPPTVRINIRGSIILTKNISHHISNLDNIPCSKLKTQNSKLKTQNSMLKTQCSLLITPHIFLHRKLAKAGI
jgi:hypothetical protein